MINIDPAGKGAFVIDPERRPRNARRVLGSEKDYQVRNLMGPEKPAQDR